MSKARLNRLKSDYEMIKKHFTNHPHISFKVLKGNPPEKYEIKYSGIVGVVNYNFDQRTDHTAVITLGNDYPKKMVGKPKCVLDTPIYHPNFGAYICIGDHWNASSSLSDVIVQIGHMIQFMEYNVNSPLNADAANWVRDNESRFPFSNISLYAPEEDANVKDDMIIELGETSSPSENKSSDDNLDIDFIDSGDSGDSGDSNNSSSSELEIELF